MKGNRFCVASDGWFGVEVLRGKDAAPFLDLYRMTPGISKHLSCLLVLRLKPRCGAVVLSVLQRWRSARKYMLTIESHDPVHNERASFETPRQLTRLSCPWRVPTRSPRRTSQTCNLLSASCFLENDMTRRSVPCTQSRRNQQREGDRTRRMPRR